MLRRLIDFFTNMDAQAWRTLAVSFVLFGGVGVVFLFGAQLLGLERRGHAGAAGWARRTAPGPCRWRSAPSRPWPSSGVPQFVLIAAAVVAFGPWTGFAYSWIGTMVSSLVGF